MIKVPVLKLKNPSLKDYEQIYVEDVRNIIPVIDKAGNAQLLINFYDNEFCINTSTFCDEVEKIIIEEYES